MSDGTRHLVVVANETVSGRGLVSAIERRAEQGPVRVTVLCPVNRPRDGYVVYEDTRRAAAGRRLDRTVDVLREAGISAHGVVVDSEPVETVRDALARLEPDELIVSTHPQPKSGWLRRYLVDQMRRAAGELPFEHVVVDLAEERGEANVLVLANETVLAEPLLDRIRERAGQGPASFLLVCPQSDPDQSSHPEAERRLRVAVAQLRGEGIDAHGQIAHPDPFTAASQACRDERIDEVIVSTFPGSRSGWLRRDLVERLRKETKLPVEHVVAAAAPTEVTV